MSERIRVSMVIPAHNERESIGEVLDSVKVALERLAQPYEIIVVDDGSTDGTGDIAEEKGVRVISFPKNRGVGRARSAGLRKAEGDIVVMIDADTTYPAGSIPDIVLEMRAHDMVIGARSREAGTLSLIRRPTKAFIKWLASYLVGEKILDLNSGLRAFRRDCALRYLPILPKGHSWVSTITIAFLNDDLSVGYVPIEYHKRRGKSTFHPVKDTLNYLMLVMRTVAYFNPLKIFLPVSLLLFVAGIFLSVFHYFRGGSLEQSDIILVISSILISMMGLMSDLVVASRKGPL